MQVTICLIIFAATMVAFVTLNKKVPISVIAITAMILLVLTGCLDKKTALGCFGNANVVMLGGMFIVSAGLNRTQMAKKMAQWVCKVAHGSFTFVLAGYVILTYLLCNFVYSPLAICTVVFPMAVTVCKELDVSPSKMIYPILFVAVATCPALPLACGAQETAIINGYLETYYPGTSMTIAQFGLGRSISGLVAVALSIFLCPKMISSSNTAGIDTSVKAKAEKEALSPVKEVIGYVTFFVVMLGLFFADQLGLSSWQIAVVGAVVIGITGVLDKKEMVESMEIGMLMMYVGCLAIANALSATGTAELIGNACGKIIFASKSNIVANLVFYLVPFIMTQFMLNGGVEQIFYSLWAMTCCQLGCNPIGAMILCLAAGQAAYFTPLATPAVPLAMRFGGYDVKDLFKMGWLPTIILTVVSVVSVAIIFPIF